MLDVRHGRQRINFESDFFAGIDCLRDRFRDDHDDRLANMTHPTLGKCGTWRVDGRIHREPPKGEIRDVADACRAQVFSGHHRKHAGRVARLAGMNGADQAVAMTGPKKDRAGLTGHIDVVGERSLSGKKPSVFTTPHRLRNSELVCHGARQDYDEAGWCCANFSMIILKKARILGRLGSRAYLPGSRLSKVLYLGCGLLQRAGRMASLGLTAGSRSRRSVWLAQQTRVLCVLFFLAGFPALIYQLTWQRALFLIFGVNIESVTIVVTAFMLGLGFGSLAGGWLSKRRAIPLLPLLAGIEFLTGAFGLVSLTLFDKIGDITMGLSLPAIAAAALALVIVPTLLMGATLPVLVG